MDKTDQTTQMVTDTIEQRLDTVLRFWFPDNSFQEFWFSNEYDSKIRVDFFDLWTQIKNFSCHELIKMIDLAKDKHKMCLGIVIVLDQFSRNLLRPDASLNNDRAVYGPTDELCMNFLDQLNLGTKADLVVQNTITFESYPVHQRIFMLLPFRHQRKTDLLNFVMLKIKQMEIDVNYETKTEQNIISRFKTATLKDYTKVTDTIVHTLNDKPTKSHLFDESSDLMNADTSQIRQKLEHVLDEQCIEKYTMRPIALTTYPICQTNVYVDTANFLRINKIKNVCISLSGGVDSMVLCLVLCQLRKESRINNLVAVHVDYGNREVSRDEASVTANWCAYLGIPFITRRIEHMKRDGPTIVTESVDRTMYEVETKNIRFNLYRQAMKLYDVESVMLGHHRDDLAENVLMNVLRGGEVLNLFTMKPHQVIDGVPISRPMLGLPKSDIYEIAHMYEVPYLKDTTPEDCFRGTVRKIVVPALQKIDPAVLLKINKIGTSSDRWNHVVGTQVIDPMIKSAIVFKHGFVIPFKESYSKIDVEVWKNVLSGIFHGNGIRMISNKNLINFMKWLPQRSGFNRLSNGHMAMSYVDVQPNTSSGSTEPSEYLVILKSGICSRIQELPCIKDKSVPLKFDMEFTQDSKEDVKNVKTVVFNGWTIRIQHSSPDDTHTFDNRMTLEDMMNGKFHLYYRTCKHCTKEDAEKNSNRYCSVDDDASDHGNITYSMGVKSSDNKRFFKGLGISRYIPNVHFGVMCKQCRDNKNKSYVIVYRIEYSYE